jgi:hypothetical protein
MIAVSLRLHLKFWPVAFDSLIHNAIASNARPPLHAVVQV